MKKDQIREASVTYGELRIAYKILVSISQKKRPLGRARRRWYYNIKMDLKEDESVDWIKLAQS